MGRQLVDVDVQYISLVKKAANREKITIYKSADYDETEGKEEKGTMKDQITEKADRAEDPTPEGFFNIVKAYFGFKPKVAVEKSKDIKTDYDYTSFSSRMDNVTRKSCDAIYTLEDIMFTVFWDSSIEDGKGTILKAVDEFKVYINDILNDATVSKEFFAKDQTRINSREGGKNEMNKEELQKELEPINKAIADLTEQVSVVVKSVQEDLKPKVEAIVKKAEEAENDASNKETLKVDETNEEEKEPTLEQKLSGALEPIQKSIDKLGDRIKVVEEARGISKQADDQSTIQKEIDEFPFLKI